VFGSHSIISDGLDVPAAPPEITHTKLNARDRFDEKECEVREPYLKRRQAARLHCIADEIDRLALRRFVEDPLTTVLPSRR
jgi:hypothetical protein